MLWHTRFNVMLCFLFPSFISDGLQSESPVYSGAGESLFYARWEWGSSVGPLHSGVHAASEHDPGIPWERYRHDRQCEDELRRLPFGCHYQTYVKGCISNSEDNLTLNVQHDTLLSQQCLSPQLTLSLPHLSTNCVH